MLYCTEIDAHNGLDGRGIGVRFRLCRSDDMLRIVMLPPLVAVMRCVPYFTRDAHITFAENITHEVRTTFRVRNTSLKKAKSKLTWLFLAGAGGLGLVATTQSRVFDFGFATLLGLPQL